MFRHKLLIRIGLPVLAATLLLPAASEEDGPAYVLQEFRAENSFVVRPGEMRQLRTRIQRTDGSGVPGVAVLFAAPTEGPSGSFAGATGPSGSFIRVETDASGVAATTITTNDVEGTFEVGVRVEGLAAFNQFSFTNTAELPTTGSEPQDVREAVHATFLDQASLGVDVQLHGPVFLRAGSIVTAPGRPDPVRPDYPIQVKRDSWLMWIDEAPTGLFAHDAQWILMDASLPAQQAADEAQAYRVRWFPVVIAPGETTGWALHYPAGSHPEAFNPDLFPELEPLPAAVRVEQTGPGNACLIAIRGPGLRGAQNDVFKYVQTHVTLGQVSSDRVFTNGFGGSVRQGAGLTEIGMEPVSTADIRRLVARAVSEKCTKVYFLMSSHGLEANNNGGGVITTDRGSSNPLSFEEYAHILAGLKEAGDNVEMCLFQSSCYAGQISQWLWGLGLPGSVVTPADESHMAWEDPGGRGSIYLELFLRAKRAPQIADANGDGTVSDDEAKRVIEQRVQPSTQTFGTGDRVERIFDPGPGVSTISGNPNIEGRWAGGEDVYMTGPGSRGAICIRRPRSMPANAEFKGTVRINNADVAANRAFDPTVEGEDGAKAADIEFTMAPGENQVKLGVTATGCGISRFRFFGKAKDADGTEVDYSGTAFLQVGHFIVIDPDAPTPPSVFGPAPARPVKKVTIAQGSSKRLILQFIGRDFNSTAPATTPEIAASRAAQVSITPRDDSITTPNPETVMKAPLETVAEFTLSGDKVGKTKVVFVISNRYSNVRDRPGAKEIEVEVVAPPEKKVSFLAPCGESTTQVAVGTTGRRDPGNHEAAVGAMPNAFTAEVMLDRGSMYFRGGPPLLADMSGAVDCMTGEFELSGDTGTRIPGYPRAPGRAVGRFPMQAGLTEEGKAQAVDPIVITYEVGRGVFPGEPIEYDLEAVALGGGSGECEYELSLTTDRFLFAGGETTATVNTDLGCQWTAVSDSPDWLGLQGAAERVEGTGPGAFVVRAVRNPDNSERAATVTVEGQEAMVTQAGTREAGPVIDSVVNGASFASGVAARSWLTIGGWNLAETTRIWSDGDFSNGALPTNLDDVSVTINGSPAYTFFISPGQLNVLSDEAVDGALALDVVVSNAQGTSAPYRISGLPLDPALFLFDPFGRQYAAAVHADGTFAGRTDLFPGLTLRPAKGGDVVLFFGAGFGPTAPMQPSGQLVATPASLARPVTVRIGGLTAQVLFAGRVSSGLYQFNVVIPEGLEPGDHLVEMFVDATPIQPGVLLTVE